jgi:hypothetical protein
VLWGSYNELDETEQLLVVLERRKAIELQQPRPPDEARPGKVPSFSGTGGIGFRDWVAPVYMLPGRPTKYTFGTRLDTPAATAWNNTFLTRPEWSLRERILHLGRAHGGSGSMRAMALGQLQTFQQGRLGIAEFNAKWLNLAVEAGVHQGAGIVLRYASALNSTARNVFVRERLEREPDVESVMQKLQAEPPHHGELGALQVDQRVRRRARRHSHGHG